MSDDPEQLRKQYMELRSLYFTMIGNLYPQLVYKALKELRSEYANRSGLDDLPDLPPPTSFGYAPPPK